MGTCRIGRPPKISRDVIDSLCREYLKLKASGKLARSWFSLKAAELRLHADTLRRYVREAAEDVQFAAADPRQRAAMGLSHFDHEAKKRGPGSRTVHASKWEVAE